MAVGLAHCPEGKTVSPAHYGTGTSGYRDDRSPGPPCPIANYLSLATPQKQSCLHMSKSSGSERSGSLKASVDVVTVARLALERVSMAECMMGSQRSSMFGITNIFCENKNGNLSN